MIFRTIVIAAVCTLLGACNSAPEARQFEDGLKAGETGLNSKVVNVLERGGSLSDQRAPFQILFGVFAPSAENQPATLATETQELPLRLRETGFRWGFAIVPTTPSEYTWRAIFHLPKPPKSVGAVGHEVKRSEKFPEIGEIPLHHASGPTAFVMNFDPGDPVGVWKLEIFVNERLAKAITFHVEDDTAEPVVQP